MEPAVQPQVGQFFVRVTGLTGISVESALVAPVVLARLLNILCLFLVCKPGQFLLYFTGFPTAFPQVCIITLTESHR